VSYKRIARAQAPQEDYYTTRRSLNLSDDGLPHTEGLCVPVCFWNNGCWAYVVNERSPGSSKSLRRRRTNKLDAPRGRTRATCFEQSGSASIIRCQHGTLRHARTHAACVTITIPEVGKFRRLPSQESLPSCCYWCLGVDPSALSPLYPSPPRHPRRAWTAS